MPKGLRRFHASGQRRFITCSCYRRQQFLGSARRRDLFLNILDEVRQQYDFVVWGYVVMPEHFHLLISEPAKRNVATAMQVLKQRVSRRCRRRKKSADQMTLWDKLPPRAADTMTLTCFAKVSTWRSHAICIAIR
jgi:REP element-mobilizing transposase RayT